MKANRIMRRKLTTNNKGESGEEWGEKNVVKSEARRKRKRKAYETMSEGERKKK